MGRIGTGWVLLWLSGFALGCATSSGMPDAARRSNAAYRDARTASSQRTQAAQVEREKCDLIENETGQSCKP